MKSVVSGKLSGIKHKMGGSLVYNIVRVILIAHIVATSYWPTAYISIFQHLATRIVIALLVVALLFWDVIAGALLAILLVLSIQDAKSRNLISTTTTQPNKLMSSPGLLSVQSHIHPSDGILGDLSKLINWPELKKDAEFLKEHAPEIKRELVAAGVYGQQQVPQITASDERVGAYMQQIGELGISQQIRAGQGVQVIDGVPSIKVNMEQRSAIPIGFLGISNKEGLATNMPSESLPTGSAPTVPLGTGSAPTVPLGTGSAPTVPLGTGSAPTVPLGTEYDHPANKTMSENLRLQATGFITDKNLLDVQINSITGLDGSQPPCFVASQSGIWNAQGFGSIARAVDNEDCPHSFV